MTIRTVALAVVLVSRVALAEDVDDRSPTTALAWSVGGSLASIGLVAAGAVGVETQHPTLGWAAIAGSLVTPSLGEWYAGKYLTIGLGLRAVGAATVGAGIAYSFCNDATCSSDFGHALIGIGLVAAAAGIGYDIATAGAAARDYNVNHHRVAIMPAVLRSPSGPAMGVGIGGAF